MSKRYHCEFKDCMCIAFLKDKNSRCNDCKHGEVWHSRKEAPPSDSYLQFYSVRESARHPIYASITIIDISNNYCVSVDDLPA